MDQFVLGDSHFKGSKSPGLAKNVLAIIELIFDKTTVAAAIVDAAEPPTAKKDKTARKDRHMALIAGGFGAAAVGAAGIDGATTSSVSISDLKGASSLEGGGEAVRAYIRERYGNHAALVIQILTALRLMASSILSGVLHGSPIRMSTVRSAPSSMHEPRETSWQL